MGWPSLLTMAHIHTQLKGRAWIFNWTMFVGWKVFCEWHAFTYQPNSPWTASCFFWNFEMFSTTRRIYGTGITIPTKFTTKHQPFMTWILWVVERFVFSLLTGDGRQGLKPEFYQINWPQIWGAIHVNSDHLILGEENPYGCPWYLVNGL